MKLTDRTKGILAGVLCFMLVIVGTAAFSCFFVGVVCTLDSVFSGADMTTWETDPYIMDVDIGIIAVYLCGLYYLLSLPLIRMKRKSIIPGITATAVIAVLPLTLCVLWGLWNIFIIPFSLLALLTVRRKYKTYCIGIAAVCISAAVSIAVSYLVVYIQMPVSQELYSFIMPSCPTRNFSQFMGYAVQPMIICAVCFVLFFLARRKEKNTEDHPDKGKSTSVRNKLGRIIAATALITMALFYTMIVYVHENLDSTEVYYGGIDYFRKEYAIDKLEIVIGTNGEKGEVIRTIDDKGLIDGYLRTFAWEDDNDICHNEETTYLFLEYSNGELVTEAPYKSFLNSHYNNTVFRWWQFCLIYGIHPVVAPIILCLMIYVIAVIILKARKKKTGPVEEHPDGNENTGMNNRLCRWFLFMI